MKEDSLKYIALETLTGKNCWMIISNPLKNPRMQIHEFVSVLVLKCKSPCWKCRKCIHWLSAFLFSLSLHPLHTTNADEQKESEKNQLIHFAKISFRHHHFPLFYCFIHCAPANFSPHNFMILNSVKMSYELSTRQCACDIKIMFMLGAN